VCTDQSPDNEPTAGEWSRTSKALWGLWAESPQLSRSPQHVGCVESACQEKDHVLNTDTSSSVSRPLVARTRASPASLRSIMNSLHTQGVRQTTSLQADLERMRDGDNSTALQGARGSMAGGRDPCNSHTLNRANRRLTGSIAPDNR